MENVVRYQHASAVKPAKNPEFHKRSKHVELRYYFVRECYQDGRIGVENTDGVKQLADLLTKPLDRVQYEIQLNDVCSRLLKRNQHSTRFVQRF